MRVLRIATTNGIDNIKLVAETPDEAVFIRQLANAGTLTTVGINATDSLVFTPIAVVQNNTRDLISRGEIGQYNFTIRQNQTEKQALTFVKDGVAIDLSLYSNIKLAVKPERNSGAVFTLGTNTGLTISGDSNNTLNIEFSEAQTASLCRNSYYYDILFDNGISKKYLVEGIININKSVTR